MFLICLHDCVWIDVLGMMLLFFMTFFNIFLHCCSSRLLSISNVDQSATQFCIKYHQWNEVTVDDVLIFTTEFTIPQYSNKTSYIQLLHKNAGYQFITREYYIICLPLPVPTYTGTSNRGQTIGCSFWYQKRLQSPRKQSLQILLSVWRLCTVASRAWRLCTVATRAELVASLSPRGSIRRGSRVWRLCTVATRAELASLSRGIRRGSSRAVPSLLELSLRAMDP